MSGDGAGPVRSWRLTGPAPVAGVVEVPGDKSISHRALLLGAMAHGATTIRGLLQGEDCRSTLAVLRALGVEIREAGEGIVEVHGRGMEAWREAETVLEAGNSGTTLRLMAGALAGRPFCSVLTGDASLRRRPMRRIAEPLRAMGAAVLGREHGGFPPLTIVGGNLRGIRWSSPVASAQVKSAVLLAGLQASGETSVSEPVLSRDHTERMLTAFGMAPRRDGTTVTVPGRRALMATQLIVPGDLSSAAFFLVAAAARPGAEVCVRNVCVNPTRTGVLDVLEGMGARVRQEHLRMDAGEPVADVVVTGARLRGLRIGSDLLPRLIDEVPALAVAAALAEGETAFDGAAELRVKEVDRLAAIAEELGRLGVAVSTDHDRLCVRGGAPLRGATVSSRGDHRMAMSLAVAGLFAEGQTVVRDVACAETSFPGFGRALAQAAPACALREEGDHGRA
jgi:3-phosphoshikimate 1-carboxyvinyltransferase